MSEEVLFELQHVSKFFPAEGGKKLKAVDDISLKLKKGEIFGLVGESGCGKSTLGKTLVRLHAPSTGNILYKGRDISTLKGREARKYASEVQMIFQDPYASLDPRMTIEDIIMEGMKIHDIGTRKQQQDHMYELLEMVGLSADHARRFPYEFSGGQRQRVGIARALAVNPEFIVCDEPVSALDVSVRAQIINLLKRLQKQLGLTLLFVAHDLSVVRYFSDRIGVMYLGSLVEVAEAEELFLNPIHPYTRGLLAAIPVPDPHAENAREKKLLSGDVPSPVDLPPGCKFASRCPYATRDRKDGVPQLEDMGSDHMVACFCAETLRHSLEGGLF